MTGVDGEPFRRRVPYPSGPSRVVAVGRLVEKKGFGRLVEAAALLREFQGLERVTIVGDGPLRAQLEEHAALAPARIARGARRPATAR